MRDAAEAYPLRAASFDSATELDELPPLAKQDRPRRSPVRRLANAFSRWTNSRTAFNSRPLGLRSCAPNITRRTRHAILFLNSIAVIFCFLLFLSVLEGLLQSSYASPPPHYHSLEQSIHASTHPGRGNPYNEKIFIASNIIREDLIRGKWGHSLMELVRLLGPENVFVSIYENDSGPGPAQALSELAHALPCNHSVTTGAHLPLEGFPSVMLPNGEPRVKRLAYLSEVRNRLLWPLDEPTEHHSAAHINYTDVRFDRILFINDVLFNAVDALHLLFSTNKHPSRDKPDYRAACAADFIGYAMFYDTFVVRDLEGYGMGLMFFPWFTAKGRGGSRRDVLSESDAVRVLSCWGGMVAYQAEPFLRNGVASTDLASHTGLGEALEPLRFRYEPELYWEASECCLLNADLAARYNDSDSQIFLNPYIRVAYAPETWSWISFVRRIERGFRIFQSLISAVGYPEYNPRRTEIVGQPSVQQRWHYDEESLNEERVRDLENFEPSRLSGTWAMTEKLATPGGFCGQKRLFVMKRDLEKANTGNSGRNWEKGIIP